MCKLGDKNFIDEMFYYATTLIVLLGMFGASEMIENIEDETL